MRYNLFPKYLFLSAFLSFGVFIPGSVAAKEGKIERQVDSVFATLNLREKVAQLFIVDFSSTQSAKLKAIQNKLVQQEKVGGLITMNDKLIPAMQRLNYLNRLASVPMLISIDGEWGASMRYKEVPAFPRQMQLGALGADSLIYKMGYAIGKECRDLKIQVNYAPDVDVNNNPDNPVINTRSFGEDKEKVARFGAAYMRGMKDAGVAGSAKHFPGHGDTDVDSHKALPQLPFSKERLDSLEIYPFRHLIREGVDMVMVGHLNVQALDSSGRPASVSKPIITNYLREELGYNGIICTDALNMDGVAKSCGLEKKQIPLEAYKAGADILLMPQDVEASITEIVNVIKSGELKEEELDGKVKKMLTLKARLGLFDQGYSPYVNLYKIEKKVVKDENIALINNLVKSTITVATNDNILPVGNVTGKKIAYLGYRGEKFGKEFAQTLMKYAPVDTLILRSPVTPAQLEAAKQKLMGYDLIITGFHQTDSRPQRQFGLDSVQVRFLTDWAAQQPMVAVYFGSPYALNRISGYRNFKSFVVGYANTLENNFAAAQVLFGGTPALGVLPVQTAGLKVGESEILSEQVRLGYDVYRGDGEDSLERLPVLLKEQAQLLTILPMIGRLLDDGRIKQTTLLGDILKLPMPKHDHIMLFDLLNHRSGLPVVSDHFVFNTESVLNFNLAPKLLPEYSNANIYYLYEILKAIDNKSDKDVLSNADTLLKMLEMGKSSVQENRYIESTQEDFSKFLFMIRNHGKYAGKQVLSSRTAKLIETLLPYYLLK
ncbi:MAG: glycoside hydrolase family 3 protein [Bacteroidales bacterium]